MAVPFRVKGPHVIEKGTRGKKLGGMFSTQKSIVGGEEILGGEFISPHLKI